MSENPTSKTVCTCGALDQGHLSWCALSSKHPPLEAADVKLAVLKVSLGICSLPEIELFHKLEEFYLEAYARGRAEALPIETKERHPTAKQLGVILFRYIDRLNDATPEDPVEKIVDEMLTEANALIVSGVVRSPEETECDHPRSELLARKGEQFEMRKCLDCTKIFRVRLPEKASGEPDKLITPSQGAWYCVDLDCRQLNSSWASTCGRCGLGRPEKASEPLHKPWPDDDPASMEGSYGAGLVPPTCEKCGKPAKNIAGGWAFLCGC
jgi:hypothetical protein